MSVWREFVGGPYDGEWTDLDGREIRVPLRTHHPIITAHTEIQPTGPDIRTGTYLLHRLSAGGSAYKWMGEG